MHVTPLTPLSILYATPALRSKAPRISATASSGPDTAVSAARCATLFTFDVECDCRFVAAVITSEGPIIHPTRQPVIAYVLATPLSTTQRSARSGTTTGIEWNL